MDEALALLSLIGEPSGKITAADYFYVNIEK
jgi:hypothetical protein